MVNVFETIITKLLEVGFYDLLIFVISFTLFYALLKKVKFFGESQIVVAILAFCMAFLIFGYPVIVGFSMTVPLMTLFTQSFVWILFFFIGFLIAGFFYPDLPKLLAEKMTSRNVLYIGVVIGLVSVITSGMINVIWTTAPAEGSLQRSVDTSILAAGVIIFVVLLIVASQIATYGT
jgi:hypothetical protein